MSAANRGSNIDLRESMTMESVEEKLTEEHHALNEARLTFDSEQNEAHSNRGSSDALATGKSARAGSRKKSAMNRTFLA